MAIVLNEWHLRSILKEWVTHYNRGRPHASLGPGIPGVSCDEAEQPSNGHHIPDGHRVVVLPILAGCTTNTGWNPKPPELNTASIFLLMTGVAPV